MTVQLHTDSAAPLPAGHTLYAISDDWTGPGRIHVSATSIEAALDWYCEGVTAADYEPGIAVTVAVAGVDAFEHAQRTVVAE